MKKSLLPATALPLQGNVFEELAWYCVRSRQKQEHIAAASLRRESLEVFNPRIRFRRPTARGPIWFVESMFPGYLFARFSLKNSLDLVRYALGVVNVVHFAHFWPVLPAETINALREIVGEEEVRLVRPGLQPGREIEVVCGAFAGLHGIVTRVMPARDRIAVLLEFLGQQTTVELPLGGVSHGGPPYALPAA